MTKKFNKLAWEVFAAKYIENVNNIKKTLGTIEDINVHLEDEHFFNFTTERIVESAEEGLPYAQMYDGSDIGAYINELNQAALNMLNFTNNMVNLMSMVPEVDDYEEYDENSSTEN